jgi:hypothetical protein
LSAPLQIVRFEGPVSWVPGPGATGITLLGRVKESGSTPAQLSLLGTAGLKLPATLEEVTVETVEAQSPPGILLRSGAREWRIACRTWQLHRDVGVRFYAAIPPRPTPWTRRLTWRVLLGAAATAPGHWLLSRQLSKKSNRV